MPAVDYYVVLFTSQRTPGDDEGYAAMAQRMLELAAEQPGYLGVESVRDEQGLGITASYWANRESIHVWGNQTEHQLAQQLGKQKWYEYFRLRIGKVETESFFPATNDATKFPPSSTLPQT